MIPSRVGLPVALVILVVGVAAADKCTVADDCNGSTNAKSVDGNRDTGCECKCRAAYSGATCGECSPGYGFYPTCVRQTCTVEDDCNGSNNAKSVDGNRLLNSGCKCKCRSGFTGPKCDACSPGYGFYPTCVRQTCTLEDDCNGLTNAKSVDGNRLLNGGCKCKCRGGHTGVTCDACRPGYGPYPECKKQLCTVEADCGGSTNAHKVDGNRLLDGGCKCKCKKGFSGPKCDADSPQPTTTEQVYTRVPPAPTTTEPTTTEQVYTRAPPPSTEVPTTTASPGPTTQQDAARACEQTIYETRVAGEDAISVAVQNADPKTPENIAAIIQTERAALDALLADIRDNHPACVAARAPPAPTPQPTTTQQVYTRAPPPSTEELTTAQQPTTTEQVYTRAPPPSTEVPTTTQQPTPQPTTSEPTTAQPTPLPTTPTPETPAPTQGPIQLHNGNSGGHMLATAMQPVSVTDDFHKVDPGFAVQDEFLPALYDGTFIWAGASYTFSDPFVFRIDEETGASTRINFPKFFNGVYTGRLRAAAFDGAYVWWSSNTGLAIRVTPKNGFFSPFSGWPATITNTYSSGAFTGGVFIPQLSAVWLIPYAASGFVQIAQNGAMTAPLLKADLPGQTGASVVPDGQYLWLSPASTAVGVIRIDPVNPQNWVQYNNLPTLPAGVPSGTSSFTFQHNAVFDGQNVWFLGMAAGDSGVTPPLPASTFILKVNAMTGVMSLLMLDASARSFSSMAFDGEKLWLTPYSDADPRMLVVNTADESMSRLPASKFPAGYDGYANGLWWLTAVATGKSIWLVPHRALFFVKIGGTVPTMRGAVADVNQDDSAAASSSSSSSSSFGWAAGVAIVAVGAIVAISVGVAVYNYRRKKARMAAASSVAAVPVEVVPNPLSAVADDTELSATNTSSDEVTVEDV